MGLVPAALTRPLTSTAATGSGCAAAGGKTSSRSNCSPRSAPGSECSTTPTGPTPRPKPASCCSSHPSASSYAAARSNSIPTATAKRSNDTSAPSSMRGTQRCSVTTTTTIPTAVPASPRRDDPRGRLHLRQPEGHRGPSTTRDRRILKRKRRTARLARDRTRPTHRADALLRADRAQTGPPQPLSSANAPGLRRSTRGGAHAAWGISRTPRAGFGP